jgi:hypothetical protein
MTNPPRPKFLLTVPVRDATNDTIIVLWNSIRSDIRYFSSQEAFPGDDIPVVIGLVQSIDAFFSSLPDCPSAGLPGLYADLLLTHWPQVIEHTSRHTFETALPLFVTFFANHVKSLRLSPDISRKELENLDALNFQLTTALNAAKASPASDIKLGPLEFCIGLVTRTITHHTHSPPDKIPADVDFEAAARKLSALKTLTEKMQRFADMKIAVRSFVGPLSKFLAFSLESILADAEVQYRELGKA